MIYINQTYTVKRGDSLYSIATKYGISVQDLYNYNNLKSNVLQIGQVLKIPSSSNFITYTVKGGDTIFMGNNE